MLSKKRKIGRKIEDINIGEKLEVSETIEDQDLLLYLGLTNDNNPLFIQHDYASLTPFKKPIVPQVMLTGLITSSISKYFPGPGSSVNQQTLSFPNPVYHYETIELVFEVINVNRDINEIDMKVEGKNTQGSTVITGNVTVHPPFPEKSITETTFENF